MEQKEEKKPSKLEAKKFAQDAKKQVVLAWTASLGLILALAWNTVFQSFFQEITNNLFQNAPSFIAPIISAVLVTILAVFGIVILNRWASKIPKEE